MCYIMWMRLMIADDHTLLTESLENLLIGHGHEVVGIASNGQQAYEMARQLRPDVVLMDLRMPGLDGLAATKLISGDPQLEGVKVVILTGSTDDADLFEAIRAGAEGYVVKGVGSSGFLQMLEGLARGEPALTPLLAKKLLAEFANPKAGARDQDLDAVTSREMEVLDMMVQGVTSNRALAKKLGVSENTVKFHVRNILDKFHLNNRAQVVSYALRHGIVDAR